MGRYDWLYELRPIPVKEKVIEELVRHLAGDLETWPPPVEDWLQPQEQERFAPLYEDPVRPPADVYRYAFRLVRMELRREFDAIDYAMRNQLWQQSAKTQAEYESLMLLVRWLTDFLLAVSEHSGQNLGREDLVRVVDGLEREIAPSSLLA